jgi:hypothetical protein
VGILFLESEERKSCEGTVFTPDPESKITVGVGFRKREEGEEAETVATFFLSERISGQLAPECLSDGCLTHGFLHLSTE